MKHTLCLFAVVLVGCGGSSSTPELHAVGTYIGGGSYLTGSSDCTYLGTDGVFVDDTGKPSTTAERGPRFVMAPGTITESCSSGHKATYTAVVPTGAVITGPASIRATEKDTLATMYQGALVANGKTLAGKARLDWQLGPDCAGIADFAPVLGAQDTGGKDRTRSLVPTGKAGTCTLMLGVLTGSGLDESFKPQTFQTTQTVTVK